MKINAFYTNVLGANLRNIRWSWGSYDPITNRVFLRVWDDEVRHAEGGDLVLVLRKRPTRSSPGYSERRNHIELIRNGAAGFGVLCTAVDPFTTGVRNIKDFDTSSVLRFGEILTENGDTYAQIVNRIDVTKLVRAQTSETTLVDDLRSLLQSRSDSTVREALVNARVGQGQFRAQVLELWNGKCAVTGASTLDVVRASHIKPWRHADNSERLDPNNGLPLIANIDALFDAGLVSFNASGTLQISPLIDQRDIKIFVLEGARLTRAPNRETVAYLEFHYSKIFRK